MSVNWACYVDLSTQNAGRKTATVMASFLQMLAKHPEVVKQAQIEIDKVTDQERLPTLVDRESIPSVDCIMKEVFRCDASLLSLMRALI